jgi:hypothetical protein
MLKLVLKKYLSNTVRALLNRLHKPFQTFHDLYISLLCADIFLLVQLLALNCPLPTRCMLICFGQTGCINFFELSTINKSTFFLRDQHVYLLSLWVCADIFVLVKPVM